MSAACRMRYIGVSKDPLGGYHVMLKHVAESFGGWTKEGMLVRNASTFCVTWLLHLPRLTGRHCKQGAACMHRVCVCVCVCEEGEEGGGIVMSKASRSLPCACISER